MKKIIKLFTILFLTTLTLVGCSNADKSNTKKVAEEFVRNIYTVDAKKVTEYNKLDLANTNSGDIIGKTGSIIEPNAEYIKNIQSLDKSIQPLMTQKGYENIVKDRFNILSTDICAKGNYTSQVTDFIVGENVYGAKEDKERYYYEAKLEFIPTDGKAKQADVAKGYIELLKENGQWKVSSLTITVFPKLYK